MLGLRYRAYWMDFGTTLGLGLKCTLLPYFNDVINSQFSSDFAVDVFST